MIGISSSRVTMSEKTDLERSAVVEFCKAYSAQYSERLTYVEHCQPPLPDTRCTLGNSEVFIEVAHLYGHSSDAKTLLGRQGRSAASAAEQQQARFTPLHIRIGEEFSAVLERKCRKKYNAETVWLLIRNANPLWAASDFQSHLANISVPPEHPFQRIWLLCGPEADSGMIELPID